MNTPPEDTHPPEPLTGGEPIDPTTEDAGLSHEPEDVLTQAAAVVNEAAATVTCNSDKPKTRKESETNEDGKGPSQASRLVALAEQSYRIVQGTDGKAYAVDRNGPAIALPLRGRDGLRQRLARTYYAHTGAAPSGSALADALTVIEGMAAGLPPEPIGLRVASWGDGIVLDLGDPTGRAVLIRPGSWHLLDASPVLFRRTTLTGPLSIPDTTGPRGVQALAGLRRLFNVDDEGFALIIAWLIAGLFPHIPHPILALLGEQGTAKSTLATFCVRLIDDSPVPLRTPPKDIRAWSVTASAGWTVALDNISTIAPWFSDTLCKAVTGDGIVDRALFTDDDVTVLSFRRVVALTSIDAGALAGDLAERMIPVELDPIPPRNRRTDAEIQAAFHHTAPTALAGLLDLTAAVLEALPTIRLDELPRMADFARIMAALDQVTGWHTLATYTVRASETSKAVVDADPFAAAVLDLVRGQAVGWTGTAAELLETLTPDPVPRAWPRTPRAASGHLRRIAPALRVAGVEVGTDRTKAARLIALHLIGARPVDSTVTTVTPVTDRP